MDGSLSRRGVRAGGGTSSTSPNYDFHWHGHDILDESSHSCQQPRAARPLGAAGWSCCSVACGAGGGGSAPAAAPDAALMPPPCSLSFSVRPSSSPSSSPAPSSLSSSIIRVGVRRPPRPVRQYRLDGDAGLAHPVRPRGCFSASLAFFFLIALALGAHAGLVIASERGAFSREPGERAHSTGENRVIKGESRAAPAFFSRPVAWTQPTRPRGLAWAPPREERETKKF